MIYSIIKENLQNEDKLAFNYVNLSCREVLHF